MIDASLAGRRIAVPETRELDIFADLLTRRGAQVLRCPLISILDAPDPAPVLAWLQGFNAGAMDDFVIYTGEGLRRLLACMDRNAPEMRAPFVQRLGQVRTLTRGPKPARVLRELGIKPSLTAAEPTTLGVISTLQTLDLRHRHIGVQIYGEQPPPALVEFLYSIDASVQWVAPYIYADAAADRQVQHLIDVIAGQQLDAIAFTSQAQVERLLAVARTHGRQDALMNGLDRTCVAAVGPVVAQTLQIHRIRVDLMPDDSFFLKPLTQKLADYFSGHPTPPGNTTNM